MSSTPPKLIEMDGEIHSIAEWSNIMGVSPTLIYKRLARGWSNENAIKTPPSDPTVKLPTKSDAELLLNDMEVNQLPKQLAGIVPENWKGENLGEYIRRHDRNAFDTWFDEVYYKNHQQ